MLLLKEVKYLGIIKNLKDKEKDEIEKSKHKAAKQAARKTIAALFKISSPIILPILLIVVGGLILYGLIDLGIELFTAKNNPQLLYDSLDIEEVSELIEIKGNENDGYYLDFIDGIDEKLDEVVKKYNKSSKYHNLPKDINFLKKMIKAEVVTQFPDLAGKISSDSEDGFQGAVTIRRVTPNKELRRNEKYWKRRNICCRAN